MPRRPTRSRRSQRTTRKDLSRRLEDLTEAEYGDLAVLTLAEALSYETETVDEERGIVRVVDTGDLRRFGDVDDDLLERLAE
jgi:hypothetical protein